MYIGPIVRRITSISSDLLHVTIYPYRVSYVISILFPSKSICHKRLLYGELGGDRTHLPEAAVLQTAVKSIMTSNSLLWFCQPSSRAVMIPATTWWFIPGTSSTLYSYHIETHFLHYCTCTLPAAAGSHPSLKDSLLGEMCFYMVYRTGFEPVNATVKG